MSSDQIPTIPSDQVVTQQSSDSIRTFALAAEEARPFDTNGGETTSSGETTNGGEAQSTTGKNTLANVEKAAHAFIGTIIANRYRILSVLGLGAVGCVFRAQHLQLGSIAAIKVLNSNMASNQNAVKRFTREAKAASSLKHPNIASVNDFGLTDDGASYLVMDFVEGKSLATTVAGGKVVPWRQAFNLVGQICDAMTYAHGRNLVHRDLKPANIIVTKDENGDEKAVVVDFGIAKIVGEAENDQRLTAVGKTCGSPLYMSPEQCLGKTLDGRSDIYSLGCLFYEIVTGKLPFSGSNAVQTILMQVNEKPQPLQSVAPHVELPAGLESIIFKCLQKPVETRYQSMQEVKADLDRISASYSTEEESESKFTVGSVIAGRYKLKLVFSENDFSKTYQAENIVDKKQVALEVLARPLDGSDATLERFAQEIQTLSTLIHPNLTKYRESGITESGAPYFVFSAGRGKSLAKVIEDEGSLSLERTLRLGIQLCDALTYLNSRNLRIPAVTAEDVILKNAGNEDEYPVIAKLGRDKIAAAETRARGQEMNDGADRLELREFGELLFNATTGRTFTDASQAESQDFQIPHALRKMVLKCLAVASEEPFESLSDLKADLALLKRSLLKDDDNEADTSTELTAVGQPGTLTANRENSSGLANSMRLVQGGSVSGQNSAVASTGGSPAIAETDGTSVAGETSSKSEMPMPAAVPESPEATAPPVSPVTARLGSGSITTSATPRSSTPSAPAVATDSFNTTCSTSIQALPISPVVVDQASEAEQTVSPSNSIVGILASLIIFAILVLGVVCFQYPQAWEALVGQSRAGHH